MEYVYDVGQTFITTTIKEKFENQQVMESQYFQMKDGQFV